MSDVKRVEKLLDGEKLVGYKTSTGRKVHMGKDGEAKAKALSERGQKAAKTRRLRKLITGGL